MVKFVRLCFVCDLYSVPARIQPRPCRPVVYSFVQRHLRASELSYDALRVHSPRPLLLNEISRNANVGMLRTNLWRRVDQGAHENRYRGEVQEKGTSHGPTRTMACEQRDAT